ncbi:hypothetical protein [Martelella sp. AMO21009]
MRATVFLSVWLKQGFQREILFKTRSAGEMRASPQQCMRQNDTRVRKRAYASRALKSINPGANRAFSRRQICRLSGASKRLRRAREAARFIRDQAPGLRCGCPAQRHASNIKKTIAFTLARQAFAR